LFFKNPLLSPFQNASPVLTPAVVKRLESWKSPSPTKEDIENRMVAANLLREVRRRRLERSDSKRFIPPPYITTTFYSSFHFSPSQANLSAPVAKNNARFEKVNQNKVVLGETMRKALEEKKSEMSDKMVAATKKVENLTKTKVEKVRRRAGAK